MRCWDREIGPQASDHEQLLRTRTGEIVKYSQTYNREHTRLFFDFSQWGLCWIYNLSKSKFVLFLKVCLNIHACVTLCVPHARRCSSSEEGVKFSETEFTGDCESPDMNAEPRFFARAVDILNHSVLSPNMWLLVKIVYLNLVSGCINLKKSLELTWWRTHLTLSPSIMGFSNTFIFQVFLSMYCMLCTILDTRHSSNLLSALKTTLLAKWQKKSGSKETNLYYELWEVIWIK